jgi:hypothetical protein
LNSGNKIVHRSWDIIPMPDLAIDRVNALGRDQPHHMTFTDRHGRLIGNVEIPGVDDEEENDEHLPGVVPAQEWMWKEPKLKMQFRLHKLRLTISTFTMPNQIQLR